MTRQGVPNDPRTVSRARPEKFETTSPGVKNVSAWKHLLNRFKTPPPPIFPEMESTPTALPTEPAAETEPAVAEKVGNPAPQPEPVEIPTATPTPEAPAAHEPAPEPPEPSRGEIPTADTEEDTPRRSKAYRVKVMGREPRLSDWLDAADALLPDTDLKASRNGGYTRASKKRNTTAKRKVLQQLVSSDPEWRKRFKTFCTDKWSGLAKATARDEGWSVDGITRPSVELTAVQTAELDAYFEGAAIAYNSPLWNSPAGPSLPDFPSWAKSAELTEYWRPAREADQRRITAAIEARKVQP